MIRIILSISLLIGSVLWLPPTKGATIEEQSQIVDEVISLCNYYNTPCSVRIVNDFRYRAYTKYNDITYSNSLGDLLIKDELRCILFHELGHVLNQHSMKGQVIVAEYNQQGIRLNELDIKQIRHRFEYEADATMVKLLIENNKPNRFKEALTKVTKGSDIHKESISHPSTYNRIQNVDKYYKFLKDLK